MTVREYNLARQGYEAKRDQDRRQQATWMSLLLSSQYGEPITPAQLLGEEEPEGPSEKDLIKEGERKLAVLKKKYPHRF